MTISELIEALRRFPQGSTVRLSEHQIIVITEDDSGRVSWFDGLCSDSDLPKVLREAQEKSEYGS